MKNSIYKIGLNSIIVVNKKMTKYLLASVALTILLFGCQFKLYRYKHVVVAENSGLEVIERSTESNSSQGKPLSWQRTDLPLKSILREQDFVVTVYTPMNPTPEIYFEAETKDEESLDLRGAHLRALTKTRSDGHHYYFVLNDANGDPIEFDVVDENDAVLGHVKITYKVVSRGYEWILDGL